MIVHQVFYLLRQTSKGFRLNPVASVAGIVVLTASLFTLGSLCLVYMGGKNVIPFWMAESKVTLYLHSTTSAQEIDRLATELREWQELDLITAVTKEEAHNRLERQLGDWKSVLEGVGENPLPPSLEITVKGKEKYLDRIDGLVEKMRQYPQVEEVFYGKGRAQQLQSLLELLKVLGLGIGCFVALSMVFVISLVVRLSLNARADELEICSIVGATPFFNRAPFFLEGIIQGGLSATLSVAVLVLSYLECKKVLPAPIASSFALKNSEVSFICVGLVFSGMALGCLGSWLSFRLSKES